MKKIMMNTMILFEMQLATISVDRAIIMVPTKNQVGKKLFGGQILQN